MDDVPSRGPMTLSLPAFRGAARQLVLLVVGLFFALALVDLIAPAAGVFLSQAFRLEPAAVVGHVHVWQLLSYAFLNYGILNTAFALLTLWFTGSMLEEARGARWLRELFYVSTVGGALLAVLLVTGVPLLTAGRVSFLRVSPNSIATGISAPLFGMLVAFALLFGDVEFYLLFLLRMKAKYMVILGALVYVALLLRVQDSFGALLALCCGLAGLLYVRLAHRAGLASVASERYFGMRNDYFRWKRRRAARKFEVYMRKQDRVVKFDKDGRYIAPDEEHRDTNDRKWMN